MKYKDLSNFDFTKVVPNIVCSLCGASVEGSDKFCRQCGRALTRKPEMIPVATMISVLDGYYGKHNTDDKAADPSTVATSTPPANLSFGDKSDLLVAFQEITKICDDVIRSDAKYSTPDSVIRKFLDIARICKEPQSRLEKGRVYVGDINPGSDSVSTKPTDDSSVSTFNAPSDRRATMQEEAKPHCLHGDHKPETCGHCTKNGACDMTILTSMPPQYNMCPFRGSGFIFCRDAE